MTSIFPRSAAALLLPIVLAACTQNPVAPGAADTPAQPPATRDATATPAASANPQAGAAQTGGAADPSARAAAGTDPDASRRGLESIGAPEQRSVYFDFDRFDIRAEFKDVVVNHGRFLSGRADAKMLIQGNADERGSREYNLALGQRRADAVKKALILQGIREESVESVSLGEEKSKATGHDEAAWAENRRADILYKGEY